MRVSICFFLFNLIILTSMFPSLTARETSFFYCDKDRDYAVKVKELDVEPYPIVRDEVYTFAISATTGKGITKGKLVITITGLSLVLDQESYDLCTKTSCPVSSGDFFLLHKQNLPGYIPPGHYSIQIRLLGKDDEELSCIAFETRIDFIPAVVDT